MARAQDARRRGAPTTSSPGREWKDRSLGRRKGSVSISIALLPDIGPRGGDTLPALARELMFDTTPFTDSGVTEVDTSPAARTGEERLRTGRGLRAPLPIGHASSVLRELRTT